MLAKNSLLFLLLSLLTLMLSFEYVGADEIAEKKTIVFLGDSLTAGFGVESEESYPSRIQEKIERAMLQYTVINAGISGDTSAGGLARINWILKNDPDIFILALGANDALRGFLPQVTKENLSKIIDAVKEYNPDTKIIIAGMLAPPNMGEV
jgi:acyl-CoA thioesterase-1